MEQLLRLGANAWCSGFMALAADHLAGEAKRTGPNPIDDRKLLAAIEERRPLHGSATVGIVVRAAFPGDARAQAAAERRLRRKWKRKTDR